jgi:hypothetical protein
MPVVLSLCALGLVGIQLLAHGIQPEPDEGALAHLWQLLMIAQLPLMAVFAYRWLGHAPRQAMPILLAQALALATAALPVFLLGW